MELSSKYRFLVVIASVMILMCLGVAYAWGVFLVPIDQDLSWGRAKISFAVSLLLLTFSIFMVIGGQLEKKYGPRITATMGGMLVGLGWILASFSHSPLWLYLTYGILSGMGTGLSYMPSISSGIKWFPKKKGLITGIIVFGFGFGTVVLSPLVTYLIASYGWRTTMLICGIIFGVLIAIASQFLKVPSQDSQNENSNQEEKNNFKPQEMVKTPTFKLLFFTYFLSMIAGMMSIGHIIANTIDKGFSAMQAAFAITLLSFFNGLGRIAFGWLSDHLGGKKTLTLLFLAIGIAMFFLSPITNLFNIYLLAIIIGLSFGGFLAVYPPLTANYFGSRNFSVNYGLIFLGYGIGCFTGPLVGGLVYDLTKSYLMAFNLAGGLALLGALLVYTILKDPQKT